MVPPRTSGPASTTGRHRSSGSTAAMRELRIALVQRETDPATFPSAWIPKRNADLYLGRLCLLSFVALLGGAPLRAQVVASAAVSETPSSTRTSATPGQSAAKNPASEPLEEIVVTTARLNLIGSATTASQGVVADEELALTPAYRPGQVLETVPGLDVTVHSGEGKANQYLMRGYNLDHGTDLALFVDGMPVNEPTHAHGDGYADINFMIPELATGVTYTKGPYYAFEGDFASVGAIHVDYLDRIPDQASLSVGTLDFQRAFTADSTRLGNGTLLAAAEVQHYDGPWDTPGDQRKVNAVLRYSSGDAEQGYSLTAMLYHDLWNAQTDQPERALQEGLINSYGELDPSDGGQAQRQSLSMNFHDEIGGGKFLASAYVIGNHLILWNDFTHYLIDPINADQEQQREDRSTLGSDLSYLHDYSWFGANTQLLEGFHARYDFNDVSRVPTQDRTPLTAVQLAAVDYPAAFTEKDRVQLGALAGFVQATTHWSDWFRSVIGFREDYIYGSDTGSYPGAASSGLPEPKASLIFTAGNSTEFYLSYGRGYHTDDLRGVNQARLEGVTGAPLIASQTGEEAGMRQQLMGGKVAATLAFYTLKAQSETTYNPDIGQDTAGPGSSRRGFELNVTYQALRWLEFYGSYSGDRARYTSPYDDGTGHLGYYLPNAPFATGSFNVYIRNLGPWSGGIAYRYLGAYPLSSGVCNNAAVAIDFPGLTNCGQAATRQGQVFGSGYGEWNADVHYAFSHGWTAGLGVYNLLNNHSNAMEYWYVDRLQGETAEGEADIHFHPLEPIAARLSVAKVF